MAHDLKSKAIGYGIDAAVVEGMDVLECYWGMKQVVDDARERSRPWFIDLRCYRYKGHSMSDPRKYRTKDEEDVFEADDPIGKLERQLKASGTLTDESFKAMQKEVRDQVRESVAWSDASPAPGVEELFTDVFVEPWGPYTGSTQPEMNGGTPNLPGVRTIDAKEELL